MPSLISIVLPIYNSEKFLQQALDSILAQSYPHYEIIAVNDGSSDQSKQICQKYPVKYLEQPNQGPAVARNNGIKEAKGEFIAFLDSDDIWLPEKLNKQIKHIEQHSNNLCFCCFDYFKEKSDNPGAILPGYLPSGVVIKKDSFELVGLFNESLRTGEFIEWLVRCRAAGVKEILLQECLFRRRVHVNNLTRDKKQLAADYLTIIHQKVKQEVYI